MKRFLLSTIAAGITLSLLGAPLSMAQDDHHSQPGPQGQMHPPGPPHVTNTTIEHTTIEHNTIEHNTTNYAGVPHPPMPHPGPPPMQHQYVQHQYVAVGGHQWHHGDYYNGDRHYVNNWQYYHLYAPPQGCEWVQDGSQFVLIAVASGIITDVILNAASQ